MAQDDRAACAGAGAADNAAMTRGGSDSSKASGARAERLKAALRDNLKRRKAQAKARAQAAGESRNKSGPPPVEEEGG